MEEDISIRIYKELEKAINEQCFTSISSNAKTTTDEPLTTEKLLKTIKDLQESLPSFSLLDQMIDQGYNIGDLVLMVYSEKIREETIPTRYGALKVMGSPMFSVERAYLLPNNPYKPVKFQWT